jgi:hypothetical protein
MGYDQQRRTTQWRENSAPGQAAAKHTGRHWLQSLMRKTPAHTARASLTLSAADPERKAEYVDLDSDRLRIGRTERRPGPLRTAVDTGIAAGLSALGAL